MVTTENGELRGTSRAGDPVREPPRAQADSDLEARIRRIERFADLMDTRIRLPVVGWRMGLDGLIGLVPGIGDTVATAASAWLIGEAWRCGARKRTLAQMGVNVGVDWAVGLVPLVGDILDIAHKANAKNARLLVADLRENGSHVESRMAPRRAASDFLMPGRRKG